MPLARAQGTDRTSITARSSIREHIAGSPDGAGHQRGPAPDSTPAQSFASNATPTAPEGNPVTMPPADSSSPATPASPDASSSTPAPSPDNAAATPDARVRPFSDTRLPRPTPRASRPATAPPPLPRHESGPRADARARFQSGRHRRQAGRHRRHPAALFLPQAADVALDPARRAGGHRAGRGALDLAQADAAACARRAPTNSRWKNSRRPARCSTRRIPSPTRCSFPRRSAPTSASASTRPPRAARRRNSCARCRPTPPRRWPSIATCCAVFSSRATWSSSPTISRAATSWSRCSSAPSASSPRHRAGGGSAGMSHFQFAHPWALPLLLLIPLHRVPARTASGARPRCNIPA